MTDYILMLAVPFAVAVFVHGASAVINVVISVVTCVSVTIFGKKVLKTDFQPKSPHSYVIGLSVALLLPVTVPWWMIILTALFAMGVCVLPFGTPDNAPFIPSASAICFATLCWPEEMFGFSDSGSALSEMLLYGNSIGENVVAVLEVLVGIVPSAMGTGCILALFGSLIFLVIRRPKDSLPVFTFLLAVCLMAALFPRVSTGRFISVIMELCSGMIFFGAVFFMSIPSIIPERILPRLLWGFAGGIICMLIRFVSPIEESSCFGFMIICAVSDWFNKLPLTSGEKKKIRDSEPFIETVSEPFTVVPDEILDEIPDMTEEEIAGQTEWKEKFTVEIPAAESLDAVIAEENSVTKQDSPFIIGGDGNEK